MTANSLALSLLAAASFSGASAAQNPCGRPHLVDLPTPANSAGTFLTDVCAFAVDDVWAVGSHRRQVQGQTHSLAWILHWDGTRFHEVPCPSPTIPGGRAWCELHAVAGVATDDLWAAGTYERQHPNNGHIGPQIFLLHWDGSSWTQVPEPMPTFSYMASSSGSRVLDILAHATNDVEFFGWWSGDQTTPSGSLTAHWDGSGVTVTNVLTPTVGSAQRMWNDVDEVLHGGDCWAVSVLGGGPGYNPLAARRSGGSWTPVAIPTLPVTYYQLAAVGVVAANDVWIAGSERVLNPSSPTQPYVIHFDGAAWTRRPTTGFVQEFVVFAPGDVWAFGTTIERWNGTGWTLVHDLRATANSASAVGAAAVGPCDLWAVGTQWSSPSGPPVAGLAMHVGAAGAGAAEVRRPCLAATHAHGLVPRSTPRVGQPMRVAIGDPFAVTGVLAPATTAWAWALGGGPQAPCGVVMPGIGIGGAGVENLLDGTAVLVSMLAWSGPASVVEHVVVLPPTVGLAGLRLTSQAALFGGNGVAASAALDLEVGL